MALDPHKIRQDFPILQEKINGKSLIYFDNAATTQKPQVMIDKVVEVYTEYNANIHRGVHSLSQKATEEYEETRKLLSEVYNAKLTEVIFTKNDTESLNLLANSLGKLVLKAGSNIVITDAEHHSNIVPWQMIKNPQIDLRFIKFDESGFLDIEDLKNKIDKNTKIFSFAWGSNTFGVLNDIELIIKTVRAINPEIIIIIDAAQSIAHKKFNFQELGADFITFSAHKLCGPTGVGVLFGNEEILNKMEPYMGGGDMIKEVEWENTTYNDLPYKFEAGTPNIADVIAFKESLKYLENIGFENIAEYERELADYLLQEMSKLDFIEIYGPQFENGKWTMDNRLTLTKLPLVSFNVKGVHAHDVGTILDEDGIAIRTGHHCTQLIMRRLGIPAAARVSLYIYNTKEEIDEFIKSLMKIKDIFSI